MTKPTKRKSVKLTPDEFKAFKQYRKTFNTDVEFAESIGIRREILIRLGYTGSASPETIEKVRAKLPIAD